MSMIRPLTYIRDTAFTSLNSAFYSKKGIYNFAFVLGTFAWPSIVAARGVRSTEPDTSHEDAGYDGWGLHAN